MSALAMTASTAVRSRLVVPLAVALLAAGGVLGYALSGTENAAPASALNVSAPVSGTPETVVAASRMGPTPLAPPPAAVAPGYLPLYRTAAQEFGVSWLLLASIHSQETAFSTAKGTYHGRNFARCCAGPMQFNVRDGDPSMWQRFGHAFERAPRPESYPHATAKHPSVYDDFDAVMAAASLLHANGATEALDGTAWRAAYSYYGYDADGIDYANQVLARAVTWSRTGFDPQTAPDAALVAEYESLYGGAERDRLHEAAGDKKDKKDKKGKKDERSNATSERKDARESEPRRESRPDPPDRTPAPPPETQAPEPPPPKPPPGARPGPPPRPLAESDVAAPSTPAPAP